MRKFLTIIALISNIAWAESSIEVVSHVPNQTIKSREYSMVTSSHIVNVKNTSSVNTTYLYTYCTKVNNDEQCYSNKFTLKPGASFNNHDRGAVGVSLSRGQYRIIAHTQVNNVVNEAYATLTVR